MTPTQEHRYYDVGVHRVHARVWNANGDLPVVVMVHGLVVSSRYWVRMARELATTHKVIVVDLPGHGHSSKPRPYLDTRELGATLGSFLEAANLQAVTVVANSYGCPVTIEAALRDDSRMTRLVLIGPTMDSAGRGSPDMLLRFLRSVWREPLWAIGTTVLDAFQCGLRRGLREGVDMCSYRIHERLPLVGTPLHVVRGEYDFVAPATWLQGLADEVGAGPVVTVANAAHEPHAKCPAELADLVRAFSAEGSER